MSGPKWGEGFLKSGLPLEHLTSVTFRDSGWQIDPHCEYLRRNRENQEAWFELDLVGTCPRLNRSTELSFLVECKYHDLSRYWFFLPFDPPDDYRRCDGQVYNCGPYNTLTNPYENTSLGLAPISAGGIVVAENGKKQRNAVQTAIQQLVNGFAPYSLSRMFRTNLEAKSGSDKLGREVYPTVTALIPMVVTNASIYRLRTDITNIEEIRKAKAPKDIADELEWTWTFHKIPVRLGEQNLQAINNHTKEQGRLIYSLPNVERGMWEFLSRPNWIAIVNVKALSKVLATFEGSFSKLETIKIEEIVPARVRTS
jgi:hypothetical protein